MKHTYSDKHPLQSQEWEEFRKAWGNQVERVQSKSKKEIAFQVIFSKIPRTPWKIGTLLKSQVPTKEVFEELKKVGKKNNAIFIKIEPNFVTDIYNLESGNQELKLVTHNPESEKFIKLLTNNGCVKGKTLFTPTSFWIDLTRSEEELMKSFSSKTRYNIRLAQKHGVKVIENNSDKAFEKYLKLTFETAKRQGFYAHSEKYHRLMWKFLYQSLVTNHQSPIAHLLTATYNPPSHKASEGQEGEIITTWILLVYDKFLYYPYGASSDKYKNVMANNLMMWEAIKFGKKMGCTTFDLWGREEGKGFTKFKEGYNPQVVKFLGTWDLIINPTLYQIYIVAEKLRWSILRVKTKLFRT